MARNFKELKASLTTEQVERIEKRVTEKLKEIFEKEHNQYWCNLCGCYKDERHRHD